MTIRIQALALLPSGERKLEYVVDEISADGRIHAKRVGHREFSQERGSWSIFVGLGAGEVQRRTGTASWQQTFEWMDASGFELFVDRCARCQQFVRETDTGLVDQFGWSECHYDPFGPVAVGDVDRSHVLTDE